jgi:hypothetical protein
MSGEANKDLEKKGIDEKTLKALKYALYVGAFAFFYYIFFNDKDIREAVKSLEPSVGKRKRRYRKNEFSDEILERWK